MKRLGLTILGLVLCLACASEEKRGQTQAKVHTSGVLEDLSETTDRGRLVCRDLSLLDAAGRRYRFSVELGLTADGEAALEGSTATISGELDLEVSGAELATLPLTVSFTPAVRSGAGATSGEIDALEEELARPFMIRGFDSGVLETNEITGPNASMVIAFRRSLGAALQSGFLPVGTRAKVEGVDNGGTYRGTLERSESNRLVRVKAELSPAEPGWRGRILAARAEYGVDPNDKGLCTEVKSEEILEVSSEDLGMRFHSVSRVRLRSLPDTIAASPRSRMPSPLRWTPLFASSESISVAHERGLALDKTRGLSFEQALAGVGKVDGEEFEGQPRDRRAAAFYALTGYLRLEPARLKEVAEALGGADARSAAHLTMAVAQSGTPESVIFLLELAKRGTTEHRHAAAVSLADIGHRDWAQLSVAFDLLSDPEVGRSVGLSLGAIAYHASKDDQALALRVVERLITELDSDPDLRQYEAVVRGLANSRHSQAVAVLERESRDAVADRATIAASGLRHARRQGP